LAGEPTRNLTEYKSRLIREPTLAARKQLPGAGHRCQQGRARSFKRPAIVLMTDAVPNDGMPGSASNTTMNQQRRT